MTCEASRSRIGAFTLIELLIVLTMIGTLAAVSLPATNRARTRARQLQCLADLHQVGLSFQMFAQDHENRFPMNVPTREGGTREYAIKGDAYRHFQVMSNLLQQPQVLLCPADEPRHAATNWAALKNRNLSYFVGLDARPANSHQLLSGDRNITNQTATQGTVLYMSPRDATGWTRAQHGERGNILFADGRLEQLSSKKLQAAIHEHGRDR